MYATFMSIDDEDPIMQQCISLGDADFEFLQIITNSRKEKAKQEIETGKREPTIAELEIMCTEALASRQVIDDAIDTIPADYIDAIPAVIRSARYYADTMPNTLVDDSQDVLAH